jgi:GT2 family glycosyltransferase
VDPFTAQPESVVGGQTLNALPHNLYSTTSQLLVDYLYYYYNAEPGQTRFFTSNNFALSAQVFQQLSGFDVTFPLAAGEDRDLCDRLSQQGYRMDYVPTAQVLHAHELSLPKFWRQHFNYGRGAYHFHQVRSRRNAQPIKVEPFIFYIHLLTYPCQRAKLPSALLMVGLMVLSQLANVLGFVWQKYQSKPVKKA